MTCECNQLLWCYHKGNGQLIKGDFWFLADGRKYYSDKPSLSISEIKEMTGVSLTYQTFLELDTDDPDLGLCDNQAIDLRLHCSVYFVPPATFGHL